MDKIVEACEEAAILILIGLRGRGRRAIVSKVQAEGIDSKVHEAV